MIKTLKNLFKQDKERFVVPRGVQDVIPIKAIFDDGIFQVGKDKYSKSYKFTDINYAVEERQLRKKSLSALPKANPQCCRNTQGYTDKTATL